MTILKCQQGCGATFDEQRAAEFGVTEGDRCPFDGGALVRVLRRGPARPAPANTIYLDRAEIIRKIIEGDSHSGHYVLAVAPDGSEARIYWAEDNRPWDDWPADWLTTPIPAAHPTGSGRDTENAQDALQDALDAEAFAEAQRRHDEDEATWVELAEELLGEQWTDLIAGYAADLADEWLWALNGAPSDVGGPGMWGERWTEEGCEPNEQPAAFAWLHKQPITLAEAAALYPIAYSTLAEAAREGRLQARQSGATWLTTREAVDRAIAEGKLRPRKSKGTGRSFCRRKRETP